MEIKKANFTIDLIFFGLAFKDSYLTIFKSVPDVENWKDKFPNLRLKFCNAEFMNTKIS